MTVSVALPLASSVVVPSVVVPSVNVTVPVGTNAAFAKPLCACRLLVKSSDTAMLKVTSCPGSEGLGVELIVTPEVPAVMAKADDVAVAKLALPR